MSRPLKEREPTGELRVCTICKIERDSSQFVQSTQRVVNECLICRRARNTQRGRDTREINRQQILAAKDRPCADCGNTYPPYVMDLDHVRGDKKLALSMMTMYNSKRVAEEISKCEVVCANCHRIRTFGGVEL